MKYKLASIIHCGVCEGVVPRKRKVCAPVNTPHTGGWDLPFWGSGGDHQWERSKSMLLINQCELDMIGCELLWNFEHQFNQLKPNWSPHLLFSPHSLLQCLHCGICISLQISRVWTYDSLPCKEEALFYHSFMVRFTVKLMICIDMFLKCCAKLKLNTWVRPSGFKEPANGTKMGLVCKLI